jgi:hypothetical protein
MGLAFGCKYEHKNKTNGFPVNKTLIHYSKPTSEDTYVMRYHILTDVVI